MIMANSLQTLKLSLSTAIDDWICKISGTMGWDDLNTYIGDSTAELMADSAFNILLAQKDLSAYLRNNGYDTA